MLEAMEFSKYAALVLGGGNPQDPFAQAHNVPVKPLIPIHGRPMAEYVLRALRNCPEITHITYIGKLPSPLHRLIDVHLQDSGDLFKNLSLGLSALPAGSRILVVSADIPMLTSAAIKDLLVHDPFSDVVYPIVRKEDCEKAYPTVKRTYARLKEGIFTGGNIFIMNAKAVPSVLPRLNALLKQRKNPFALAGSIGLDVISNLLLGRLEIPLLEQRLSRILNTSARALITPHACIGTDVDKASDLTLAEKVLGG